MNLRRCLPVKVGRTREKISLCRGFCLQKRGAVVTAAQAHQLASEYAANSSNWNSRYLDELDRCGFALFPWPEHKPRPDGTIDAPLPIPNTNDEWYGTHIIADKKWK